MLEETTLDYKSIFDMGRDRKFTTNEELKERIIEYFEKGRRVKQIFVGGEPYNVPILTITGLTLYLGFADRHSFYDYENRGKKEGASIEEKEISHTLKKARAFIEQEYESQLQGGNTAGAIFALKNFGWKDVQTLEGEVNDNGERKFLIEHKRSKYEHIDENGNEIQE